MFSGSEAKRYSYENDWFCWFPSSSLGTEGVKLLLHVSFTRLAGKLELPGRVPKLELGNQPTFGLRIVE